VAQSVPRKRVLFVYNSSEHIGLTYLSAVLKAAGHEVRLAFDPQLFRGEPLVRVPPLVDYFDLSKRIVQQAVDWDPDVVGFSCYTDNFRWMLELAALIKERCPRALTVFGGVHVSAVPEVVASYSQVDALVLGEAEHAFLELVEALDDRQLPDDIANVWIRDGEDWHRNALRPYIEDLDALPIRDYRLFYDKVPAMEDTYLCMTSRGCPYSCSYCSVEMYHRIYTEIGDKTRVRKRSIDGVLEELREVKRRGRARSISFYDEVFTSPRRWLEDFLPRYRSEIGLPFWCYTYPSGLDPSLARLMADSGCWMMTMGVQSGSREVRRNVMDRRESDEKLFATARVIKEVGIRLSVDKILGSPGESADDRALDLKVFRKLNPDRILTFPLTFFPGTDMVRRAEEAGELTPQEREQLEHGYLEQSPVAGRLAQEAAAYRKLRIQMGMLSLFGRGERLLEPVASALSRTPGADLVNPLLLAANAVRIGDRKFGYLMKVALSGKNLP